MIVAAASPPRRGAARSHNPPAAAEVDICCMAAASAAKPLSKYRASNEGEARCICGSCWEGGRSTSSPQPLAAASPRMLRADQKIGHSDSGTRWWAALSSQQCQNCTEPRFVVLATVKNRAHGSRPASRQALARGAPLCLDGSPLDRRRVSHTQPERCRAARIAIAIAIALSSALDHPARRYRQLGSRYPPSLAPRSPGGP